MSAADDDRFATQLRAAINKYGNREAVVTRITRGQMVHTFGPWSNGHHEQCAIVTHVWGDGSAPGTLVNLHVFVDEGASLITSEVPWYPTRAEAEASMQANAESVASMGGAVVCFGEG
jgi:hypothetical protein